MRLQWFAREAVVSAPLACYAIFVFTSKTRVAEYPIIDGFVHAFGPNHLAVNHVCALCFDDVKPEHFKRTFQALAASGVQVLSDLPAAAIAKASDRRVGAVDHHAGAYCGDEQLQ